MSLKTWTTLALILSLIFSCKYTQKITDGKMAYERKQYSVAVDMLSKEIRKVVQQSWERKTKNEQEKSCIQNVKTNNFVNVFVVTNSNVV